VPAFHADERRDLALLLDALDIVGGERERHRVRVHRHHAVDDVDLLEGLRDGLGGVLAGLWRRHVDGPELRADAAGAQPRDVRHERRLRPADVDLRQVALRVLTHRPRVVVVAVEDGRVAQQAPRAFSQRVLDARTGADDEGQDECGEQRCDQYAGHAADYTGVKNGEVQASRTARSKVRNGEVQRSTGRSRLRAPWTSWFFTPGPRRS
jgi:hypothetical protein